MTTAFLKSTAAAALVMLSLGAQAAPVTVELNFDGLLSTATAPQAPGNLSGFSFTGAYVWESRFSTATNNGPIPLDGTVDPAVASPNNGFIANRSLNISGGTIQIDLLPVTGVTRYIKSVAFDLYVPASTPFASGYDAAGNLIDPEVALNFTGGQGSLWNRNQTVDFGDKSRVSRLDFGGSQMGTIGLDNLVIEFTASDIGNGTVPEPASYALVALALLAAGGASRRRKA